MLPVQSVRKIDFVVCGVNGIREKSLCKFVDDCGKKKEKDFTKDAENTDGIEKRGLFDFSDAAFGGEFLELERIVAGDYAID